MKPANRETDLTFWPVKWDFTAVDLILKSERMCILQDWEPLIPLATVWGTLKRVNVAGMRASN